MSNILIAEIRKIKREKKKGTTSVKEKRGNSVQPLQGRVLMIEMGRKSWRRTILH